MTEENIGSQCLPKGWTLTNLRDLSVLVTKGSTPTSYGFSYVPEGINFVKVENISNGRIERRSIKQFITEDTHNFLKRSQLAECDVLFSIAGTIGRVGIVHKEDLPANINQAIAVIRCPWKFVNPRYLGLFLETSTKQSKLAKRQRGVGMNNIGLEDVKEIEMPFPPFPEQGRIVVKIEELFTNLDAGVESLLKVKRQLRRYRQAILKYAFEGKLTEEWRKTHKDQIEPATKLLERIKEERQQKLGPKYKELPPIDTAQLPQLPEGWAWTRPGEFAQINPGFPCGKHNKDKKGIPHIRPMNIDVNGKIDLSEVKYVQRLTYDALLRGDVLFNNTNSPELLGKTAYIEEDTNWAYSNHMTRLRFDTSLLDSAYISYYLHNLFLSGFFKMNCVHHVNQASINSGFLFERVVIALPPLDEQHRIAEEIELKHSVAEETEKVIEESLMRAERLRQGILKMAFEGRLIPQDPSDEPAEKLLERIKEERAKSKGEKDTNKGRKNMHRQLELSTYVK
jgi:type I restriction enzyme S subunit